MQACVPTPVALYGTVSDATLSLLKSHKVTVTSIRNPVSYQYKIGNKLAVLAATSLVRFLPNPSGMSRWQGPKSQHTPTTPPTRLLLLETLGSHALVGAPAFIQGCRNAPLSLSLASWRESMVDCLTTARPATGVR